MHISKKRIRIKEGGVGGAVVEEEEVEEEEEEEEAEEAEEREEREEDPNLRVQRLLTNTKQQY